MRSDFANHPGPFAPMRNFFSAVLAAVCALAPTAGLAETVRLTTPIVEGSSLYTQSQLVDIFAQALGRTVSPETIGALVTSIEARYREDGFIAPVIAVEPSSVDSGTPRLHVREARISRVEVYGDAGPNNGRVQHYVDTIRRQSVIHRKQSRDWLNAIGRLPGVSVRASFEPDSTAQNQFVLVINLSYRAGSGAVDVSNRGTREVGRTIISARLGVNGVLHWQESVYLDAAASTAFDRYHYEALSLVRPLGTGTITLMGSRSDAQPYAQETTYQRDRGAVRVNMPLWQSESLETAYIVGFGAWTARVGDDIGPVREERIRKVEAGLKMVWRGAGRMRLSSLIARGLPAFGADSFTYVYDLEPAPFEFTKALLDLDYSLALGAGFRGVLEFSAQLANGGLPGAEQFGFGGDSLGKAFDPGVLTGENGVSAGFSLQRSVAWVPGVDEAALFAGADYGRVWGIAVKRDDAASASLGVTSRLARLTGSFEVAYPINRPADMEIMRGLRSFFSLRMGF
ncbi:MAG: ShlB/FhaC/HecB family hemolysin secretion/activation protein [Pseudomonadota bacterium]